MANSTGWPKWLYRLNPKAGKREGCVFNGPEDIPAGQGWMTRDEWNAARETAVAEVAREEPRTEAEQLSNDLDSLPKDKLVEIAEQAGVEFDKRWKPERIVAAIKDAAQA